MLNARTLMFGLIFGLLDSIGLPIIKKVSHGLNPLWMIVPVILYASSPFIFLKALEGETLTIMNLVWDLTSDVIVTLIGLLYFSEKVSAVKLLGVCLSFVSLSLMAYEPDGWEAMINRNISRIKNVIGGAFSS